MHLLVPRCTSSVTGKNWKAPNTISTNPCTIVLEIPNGCHEYHTHTHVCACVRACMHAWEYRQTLFLFTLERGYWVGVCCHVFHHDAVLKGRAGGLCRQPFEGGALTGFLTDSVVLAMGKVELPVGQWTGCQ